VNAQRIIFAAALALSLASPAAAADEEPVTPGRRTTAATAAHRRAERCDGMTIVTDDLTPATSGETGRALR
jgi:hypothetical protein